MANEQNLRPCEYKLSQEEAKKGGINSGKARKEKKLFKEEILKRMGESDWNEMIDKLIARAKTQDKAFEILRDTIGQKPTEKVENTVNLSYEEYINKVSDKDEY